MITLEFKKKFDLPRINEYVASLTKAEETRFWNLVWEMKQVFPNIDIYHAGSAKYGYIGFGKKKLQAKRVEDFLFVLHLKKDKNENFNFILYISDQIYKLINVDKKVLPQGYDEKLINNEISYRDWLELFKKVAIKAEINFEGQNLFPIDYGVEDYFTTLEAYEFLEKKYIRVKEATKKIVGFRNHCGKEMALILENLKPSLFIGSDPESNTQFEFNFIDNNSKIFGKYDENEGRHDGLKTHAPSLYKGHKAYYIEINSLNDLQEFCRWYEKSNDPSEKQIIPNSINLVEHDMKQQKQQLNRILFGAAGTGKTYHSINHAISIIENKSLDVLEQEDRTALKNRFDQYKEQGQIKFVTFHQSFSYEDFVEGIRAETDDEGQLSYDVKAGVFKEICEQALGIQQQAKSIEQVMDKFLEEITLKPLELLTQQNKKVVVSYLGQGLTLQCQPSSSEANATYYANINKIKQLLAGEEVENIYNRSYIKAVAEYLRPQIQGVDVPSKDQTYVLIIDEINRGNISRIFGELITLIEDSKRQGADEALSVTLPYSKKELVVPNNVYIIGTMNSSDRSLTGLDIALRRRFTFIEMPPQPKEIKNEHGELLKISGKDKNGNDKDVIIADILSVMNQRIEVLLDLDHCIGHANFMSLKKQPTLEHLESIFKQKIIPQLQEYFFDDWAKINLVLFDNGMIVENKEINIAGLFPPNTGEDRYYSEQKKIWKINEDAFKTIDAFVHILGSKG